MATHRFGHVTKVADNLWTVHTPFSFFGFDINNRMLIINVPSTRTIALINAVKPQDAFVEEIRDIERQTGSEVKYIIAPGDGHHLFLSHYVPLFPKASIFIPPGRIQTAQKDLKCTLIDQADPLPELRPDIVVHRFDGLRRPPPYDRDIPRPELFFLHAPTGTLYCCDMLMYNDFEPGWFQRKVVGLKAFKIQFHVSGMGSIADVDKARASVRHVLSWDFDRFIGAHGSLHSIVDVGAKELVREAFLFLEPKN